MTSVPFAALLLALSGCAGAVASTACSATPDVCAFERFRADPPPTSAQAAEAIRRLRDPVVKSAAVTRWLAVHPQASPADGAALCMLLPGQDQRSCVRRVNSPHLRR